MTLKKYPIRFYGRTWIFWSGFVIIGQLAVFGCIMGSLFWLDIMKSANGRPGHEAGIPLTIIGSLLMPIAIAFAFQVIARQWPVLKIYKEGLWIRSIGTPVQIDPVLSVLGFGLILIVFVMFWQLITLQMFQTRTVYWRWEDIETILRGKSNLTVVGRLDMKDNDDFKQSVPMQHSVSYGADSFGISVDKVAEAVQFFQYNPGSRETLPSWQDDETLFSNDSFDFR